jgi:DTW domain-containing protein YfiP
VLLHLMPFRRFDTRSASPANKCARCWMVPYYCLCKALPVGDEVDAGVDVVCYLHWREASMRKASNTAKLVPMLLTGGRMIACGDVGQEAELYRLLEDSDDAAILFPSDSALSVRDWIAARRMATAAAATSAAVVADVDDGGDDIGADGVEDEIEGVAHSNTAATTTTTNTSSRGHDSECDTGCAVGEPACSAGNVGATSSASSAPTPRRTTLVVLDGTWAEARQLNKFLPARATRVKLEDVPDVLARLRTRWAHPDLTNVQSFSAVIAALAECGLSPAKCDSLTAKLETAIDGYVAQTFPEKAQKPLVSREDNRAQRGILAEAVAEGVAQKGEAKTPRPPHNPRNSPAAAAASAAAAAAAGGGAAAAAAELRSSDRCESFCTGSGADAPSTLP